ncbi:hypothetical protein ASC64_14115 [Nocardioides sp. Root122]|uniref:GlsB/YeaQ/YmgE family stress response membrane protein n=1 Tax=Nocardioides TaxID=1839 RepID=UPI000702736E|nr:MULTISPECIES: GlsB/YeaQ/YmgE family stress response membrane protein [Nocardioides]KQV64854.1 hypothetical protein ASC64_14115 [Nocardioides sp. Root122]MCK9823724.1 GlsB/YeaQ/YmgE family stress response membrane protein [Nocardioides cavernae]
MLVQIIVTLIVGAVIGLLGKLIAPGDKDNIPIWLTILCGIGGAFIGSFLYYGLFGTSGNYNGDMFDTTKGPDWWRFVWEIAVAAVLVVIASTVTGRNSGNRTHV